MFLAIRDLRRGIRRFVLLAVVIVLVATLSTVLSGLAKGLVTDGISGLRALPIDHLAFEPGSGATFSRSTLRFQELAPFTGLDGVQATPLGVSFVNAAAEDGGPSLDLALFGVTPESFLAPRADIPAALAGRPGLILADELRADGVQVGDRYRIGGGEIELPVAGFTSAGTYGHVPIAFTSLETWQQIQYGSAAAERFSAIALAGGHRETLERAADAAGVELFTKTGAYAGSPGFVEETTTMTLIRAFLLVISALVIAMVGVLGSLVAFRRITQVEPAIALGAEQ